MGYSQRRTRTHAFDWVVDQPSPNEYGEGTLAALLSALRSALSLSLSPLDLRHVTMTSARAPPHTACCSWYRGGNQHSISAGSAQSRLHSRTELAEKTYDIVLEVSLRAESIV